MQQVYKRVKALCYFLAGLIVLEGIPLLAWAQDETSIKNIRYEILGTQIVIRYDLTAPTGDAYKVRVILRKESEAGFVYIPRLLSGDVGEGEFVGADRQITWDFLAEFPGGLDGDDFYFVVEAEKAPWRLSPWYYVTGGVIAVGAAVVYALTKKTETSGLPNGFPDPIGRPTIGQ